MAKRKNTNAAASLVPLLTVEQVIIHLGISERTLHRLLDARKLTCYKLDGLLRFNPADVKRFLERRALRASGTSPEPFEVAIEGHTKAEKELQSGEYRTLTNEEVQRYRILTDEQAQAFFAGIKRDEGGVIMDDPDRWEEE